MNSITKIILNALFTFIVTSVISAAYLYFVAEDVVVTITSSVEVSETSSFTPVLIENYSGKVVGDVTLIVPDSITLNQIQSSSEVDIKIEDIPGKDSSYLSINKIPPRKSVTLFLPVRYLQEEENISMLEDVQGPISLRRYDDLSSPRIEMLKVVIIAAGVYSFFSVFTAFWHERNNSIFNDKIQHYTEVIKEYKESNEIANRKLDNSDEKIKNVNDELRKTKRYLLGRITHFSKENDFWRDTIRKLLYERIGGKKEVEKIFEIINSTLRTYLAREGRDVEDIEEIEMLKSVMNNYTPDDSNKKLDK